MTGRQWQGVRAFLAWLPFLLVSVGPVLILLFQSFRPGGSGGLTLAAYRDAWSGAATWELLWNSCKLGAGVVAVTFAVGVPFGFLIARSGLRGRSLYGTLVVVPLLIPSYVNGIAWSQHVPLGGYVAIVLILALTFLPIVVLLSARGFRDVGEEMEDAARLELGEWRAFWRVTLPLARPSLAAAALLVFVLSISDFGVADFFSFAGVQGQSFQVFSLKVYFRWATELNAEVAIATAVPLLLMGLVCMLGICLLEGRRRPASLRGSHRAPRPFALGKKSWLAHAFLLLVLLVCVVVPLLVIGHWVAKGGGRVVPNPVNPANPAAPVGDVTIVSQMNVWTLLRGPARGDLLRSLWYSLAAALLVLVVAAGPARTLARGASRLGFWVLVLVPLAVPSLLLGMAQVWLFHRPWPGFDALYSGGGLVVLTYVARYAPLGVLGLRAAWVRLDPEIEEASALLVRRRARRVLQGLLPLLLPGIVATVVVCFGLAMRDLDCIVLLDGAQQTLPLRLYNKVHYARDAEVAALCLLQLCAIFVPVLVVRILAPRSFSLERSPSSL